MGSHVMYRISEFRRNCAAGTAVHNTTGEYKVRLTVLSSFSSELIEVRVRVKIHQNRMKYDQVIATIIWCSFLPHILVLGVLTYMAVRMKLESLVLFLKALRL